MNTSTLAHRCRQGASTPSLLGRGPCQINGRDGGAKQTSLQGQANAKYGSLPPDRSTKRIPGKTPAPHLTSIFALLHAVVLRRRIGPLASGGMPLILRACATRVRFVRRKYPVWAAMLHRQLRAWLAHHSQRSRTVMRASFEMLSKTLRPLTPSSMIPRSCMSPTTGRRTFRSHLTRSMLSKPSSGGRLMRC